MKKDAYYFPHFSNARQDRKIRRLRKELGIEGYGIYFMVLEVLRDQADFSYPLEDLDLLADEFGTSEQKVRTVICNYGLFNVDDEEFFFSPKFIEFLQPYLQQKERNRINGIKGNLIKYGHAKKDKVLSMSDAEIIELNESIAVGSGGESGGDRNKSKVKKSKVNKTTTSVPPKKEDVIAWLIEEKDLTQIKAEKVCEEFYSFYDQKGWKVGKSKMKKWKVALGRSMKWESIQKIINGDTEVRANAAAYKYV